MPSHRLALIALCALPGLLRADATIHYTIRMTTPSSAPMTMTRMIRMKDTKGMIVEDTQTTVIDFARQQVTVFDSASRLFATLSVAEYSSAESNGVKSAMPAAAAQMIKSMKVTCDSQPPAPSEVVAGVHSVERDVVCTMSMNMPSVPSMPSGPNAPNMPNMPAMNMKMTSKTWSPSDEESVRVPALWQLTDFEKARRILFDHGMSGMSDAFKPMADEMAKNPALVLRSVMEMSMNIGTMGTTPIMKTETEADSISTDPIDDTEFAVPTGYTRATYAEIVNSAMRTKVQAMRTPARSGAAARTPAATGAVSAYVPMLMPVKLIPPKAPGGFADVNASVQVLVTIDPKGEVSAAEALSGPAQLRQPALDAVKKWTYRPVLRDGAPVAAYTDALVSFFGSDATTPGLPARLDDAAAARLSQLVEKFPRTGEQILADAEQDATGRDPEERFDMLQGLITQALDVNAYDKVKSFATELMARLPEHASDPDYGDAFYDVHMGLGIVALHNDDVATAKKELIESARATGSPVMNSFGPNMRLASELLEKGESATVLEFLEQCRTFWKDGSAQIDEWSAIIRRGSVPVFGMSLR